MKLRSVKINNFMGIGHAHLDLADKGLVLIQGENLDDPSQTSNGAGKSSLADAVFWCFYGSTARDKLGADEVVNRTAKKDTWVEIEVVEDDGGFYTIKRWRKCASEAKKNGCSVIYTDPSGAVVDNTKGTDALTQEEIDKALGCSEDVFTAAVYAGQEKLPNLPALSDGDLKKLIEEASGVTVLIKAYDIARQRLKDAMNDLDRWRVDHVRSESDVQRTQQRLSELETRRDSFEATRASQVSQLQSDLSDAIARARKHQADRDAINKDNLEKLIAELDAKINAVEAEHQEEARLLNIEREIAGRRISMETTYRAAAERARELKADLDGIAARVGTPCGSCGKPYEQHDLATASELARQKVRDAVEKAREVASDVTELQRQEKDASTVLANFRASKTDISATVNERQRLANALASRAKSEQAMLNETTLGKRIKDDLDRKKAEQNPYVDLAKTCKEELEDALQAHRESEEAGKEKEKRVMVLKDTVKVYGPAGVRAHVLDTVTPFLNDRTAEYLGTLSDGKISAIWSTLVIDGKGELKEKFSITVEKDGAGGSFAALSGGEKRKVRLACALALQDLVASRASKPLSLFIADEIDDALDNAGLERLMVILEGKARGGGTIAVISHNSLRDWIRDVTVVTRENDVSTVSGWLSVV